MHRRSLLIVVSLLCLATLAHGGRCTSKAEATLMDQHFLQKRSTKNGASFVCKYGYQPNPNGAASSYRMSCDSKSQWNLEPKFVAKAGTASTACIERPTCKVSDLDTMLTHNNFVALDLKATTMNPGQVFRFKCKSTAYKQVISGSFSATCKADGTWNHAFTTTGDQVACMVKTYIKSFKNGEI